MSNPAASDPVWSERIPDDQYEDAVERADGLPEDGEEQGHPTTASDVSALIAKEIG